MKSLTSSLIAFFLFSGICIAEPDSTIKYLMNEPVSLLDLGIYRLSILLEAESGENAIYIVDYKWNENRIVIERYLNIFKPFNSRYEARLEINSEIKFIKLVSTSSAFKECFRHSGYSSKREPEELVQKLMGISHIMVHATYNVKNSKKPKIIDCNNSLLNSDIYCSEE